VPPHGRSAGTREQSEQEMLKLFSSFLPFVARFVSTELVVVV